MCVCARVRPCVRACVCGGGAGGGGDAYVHRCMRVCMRVCVHVCARVRAVCVFLCSRAHASVRAMFATDHIASVLFSLYSLYRSGFVAVTCVLFTTVCLIQCQ